MNNRLITPQDQYFGAPDKVHSPDGSVFDATPGVFELTQQYRSLTGQTSFSGSFLECGIPFQLRRRKLYLGLVLDDWAEYSLKGHVDFCLNNSILASLQVQKSYPPPIQIAPFNSAAGATLPPSVVIPATQFNRIVSVDQFTDSIWESDQIIENELRGVLQYDRESDSTSYIYWFRIAPVHLHIAANKVQFTIDNWTALQSGGVTPNSGVFACYLACMSQQYGNT
jgi:hypothetical protein